MFLNLKGLHNSGFIHADIKLPNVFYDPSNKQMILGDYSITVPIAHDLKYETWTSWYRPPENFISDVTI